MFKTGLSMQRFEMAFAGAALMACLVSAGELSPEESFKTLRVPDGYELTLFASEPMIENPTAMAIDAQGRVYVGEGRFYAHKITPAERIKVLEDTDGDGKADKCTHFFEGCSIPHGMCLMGNKLLVSTSPHILLFEDQDGDLKADGPPKPLLSGFRGGNAHAINGLVIGPDHRLYMSHGDTGFDVTGPDGTHVAYNGGALMRCELDGSKFGMVAHNWRNPYELCIDSFGTIWCSDNDQDGRRSVRICWVLEGGNYGWKGGPTSSDHWRADIPGFVPGALITGFGAPSGMIYYESDALGSEYRNTMLHADAGPHVVRRYDPSPSGAGYTCRAESFVSTAGDNFFAPVDVCAAPNGSVFIVDWYENGTGGMSNRSPNTGRIYCLKKKGVGRPAAGTPGVYKTVDAALTVLTSPNLAIQYLARERILSGGNESLPALKKCVVENPDPNLRARALWLVDRIGDTGFVRGFLKSSDARFRALAVRILRWRECTHDLLVLADDPSIEVRREVLLALRMLDTPAARDALQKMAEAWDGEDRFYLEALGVAAHAFKDRASELLHRLTKDNADCLDRRSIDLLRLLMPGEAIARLAEQLNRGVGNAKSAKVLLEVLGKSGDPGAGRAVAGVLISQSPLEAKHAALEALGRQLPGPWKMLRDDEAVRRGVQTALCDPELQASALALLERNALRWSADTLNALVRNPDTPDVSRTAARLALVVMDGKPAADASSAKWAAQNNTPWKAVAPQVKTASGVSAVVQADGIACFGGTAPEKDSYTFVFDTDGAPVDRLRLDVLKDGQCGPGRTLHGNFVLSELTANVAPLDAPEKAQRIKITRAIAETSQEGFDIADSIDGKPETGWAIHRAGQAVPSCSAVFIFDKAVNIERGARWTVRLDQNYGSNHVIARMRLSLGAAPAVAQMAVAPRTEEILKLAGNADQGRAMFEKGAGQCIQCHRIRGTGGEVGPELSQVGRKFDRVALLDSILRPSAAIGIEYEPHLIKTKDGQNVLGMYAERAPERIVLKTVDGKLTAIAAANIVRDLPQKTSLMPEELLRDFSAQQAADLVGYLASLEREVQEISAWSVTGLFEHSGLDAPFESERSGDPATCFSGEWKKIDDAKFADHACVDLKKAAVRFAWGTKEGVAYVATQIDSPDAQEAQLLFGSDCPLKVWLNGREIHRAGEPRTIAFGQDKLNASLKKGRNLLLVKMVKGRSEARLMGALEVRSNVTFLPLH